MKGHVGAVLTSGLAAMALALALLQAVVLSRGPHPLVDSTAVHAGATNRYSVPGGRSGIPFLPFDHAQPAKAEPPREREGQTPPRQQEHHTPPPRMRAVPPLPGPQPARRLAA